ncbi:hypothetical protein JSY17_14915 [Pseudomonas capsici]|uniref:hypothetical protein n=1 Tax=Pseudomonas capsici TaxID=2810614 RepID=UPI0019CF80A5|nr:hypothetical protein [Pseudomonas capsici]MBN6715282.1 hypothetical protein [Pseudomonas capsici]MBN6720321.1 hypothetical protein [Pseudomonas capsici]MBN6725183.1 hypothetical protein [Pseudomonas capsici]
MADLGFWGLFGVLGSLASVLSLFISKNTRWAKFIHAAYSALIVAMILGFTSYQEGVRLQLSELSEIKKIERQATSLSNPRDLSTAGNMIGYSLSVLAFLEKHQDKYPETYFRAKEICLKSNCYGQDDSLSHFSEMQKISSAMRELIRGISTLDGN